MKARLSVRKKKMRPRFNERKLQILRMLEREEITSASLAARVGIAERTARSHLHRLTRQGLLNVTRSEFTPREGKRPYVYRTSERGRERIVWLSR